MLAKNEEKILNGLLPEMGRILNAVPGEAFTSKDADTLMVIQRRLSESEIKRQLALFNEIFGLEKSAGISDITNIMIAFVKLKVLLQEGVDEFDAVSLRQLIKECRSQIDRTRNIIRLSKANAMTAEEFQKDRIEKVIRKNEAFILCFENEIKNVEKKIERLPGSKFKELSAESEVSEDDEEPSINKTGSDSSGVSSSKKLAASVTGGKLLFRQIEVLFHKRKYERDVEERLRGAEKKTATTMCEEIPYYEKRLAFTECLPCKDMSAYCILKKKNNVYFGLRAHVSKDFYENLDQSLIELTNVTEEFIQLMTENVLTEEYQLQAFSAKEKKSMQMYLNFITDCFEKHIGVTLNAAEYLAFKDYYSRLVRCGIELEKKEKENYYRAIPLADEYLSYMDAYNMIHSESRADVIRAISIGNSDAFVENLGLILDNHLVAEEIKDSLRDLISKLRYFLTPEIKDEEKTKQLVVMPKDFESAVIKLCFENEMGEIVDEATFASCNVKTAIADYLSRKAYMKKIGLLLNGKEVYLFGAKQQGVSVPLLTDPKKEIRGLSEGVSGQLILFYEEQMRNEILNLSEVNDNE